MPEQISLVLVDDDAMVRTGLRMILGGAPDIKVTGEATDGAEGVRLVQQLRPDVVLMDIRMSGLDGIAATRTLIDRDPGTTVLMLTTFDTDNLVMEALRAGASGFLLKSTPPERLVQAVRDVAQGQHTLSPSVTARLIAAVTEPSPGDENLAGRRRRSAQQRLATLTEREHEVAVGIGQGWSNAQIAARLFMGVPTVKAHVSRLLAKLEVDNRTQVALVVHDADLA